MLSSDQTNGPRVRGPSAGGAGGAGESNVVRDLLRKGLAQLSRGEHKLAGQTCKEILARAPKLPQGHFLVGLVALEVQDRKTAFQAFGSVTKLEPSNSAAWAQLAKLFMSEGMVARADEALSNACQSEPSDPLVQDLIGTVYSLMGEYEEARKWYAMATKKRPEFPPFLLNLANNQVYQGDTEAAVELFERAIGIQPNSPQAHWSLSGTRKATDTRHIETLTKLAATPNQPPREQSFYLYAIGKQFEDLERWEDAFAAFSAGAAARRQTIEFDEAAEQTMFDYLQQTFTAGWLSDQPAGRDDEGPIFILGQPRTGTTLIERIVSSHSKVHSAGELQQFSLGIRRLSNHRDPKRFSADLFRVAQALDPAALGGVYLDTTRRVRGDTPRFVDKLPQNYLCIPLILAALPKAKILHVTRDPMDACFASFKQLFADAYLHSYDQREMARHHARYRALMDSWRERFGARFLEVSYEQTVAELEPNARRIIEFVQLPWEDACLDFHTQTAGVSTASAVQVREPAHTRSVGRWRRYEQQLGPMIETLKAAGIRID